MVLGFEFSVRARHTAKDEMMAIARRENLSLLQNLFLVPFSPMVFSREGLALQASYTIHGCPGQAGFVIGMQLGEGKRREGPRV